MSTFEIGMMLGELRQDVRALVKGQQALKSEVRLVRRIVIVGAVWSTGVAGHMSADQISAIVSGVIKRLIGF